MFTMFIIVWDYVYVKKNRHKQKHENKQVLIKSDSYHKMKVLSLIAFLVLSYSLYKNIVKWNYIVLSMYMQLAIILFICSKVHAINCCEKSTMTKKYVEKCPTDAQSWKIAAEKMNCESVEQRCSDSFDTKRHQFQYHCVINAWMNATLEVCALNRTLHS